MQESIESGVNGEKIEENQKKIDFPSFFSDIIIDTHGTSSDVRHYE